jgi:hypothetical protein
LDNDVRLPNLSIAWDPKIGKNAVRYFKSVKQNKTKQIYKRVTHAFEGLTQKIDPIPT